MVAPVLVGCGSVEVGTLVGCTHSSGVGDYQPYHRTQLPPQLDPSVNYYILTPDQAACLLLSDLNMSLPHLGNMNLVTI